MNANQQQPTEASSASYPRTSTQFSPLQPPTADGKTKYDEWAQRLAGAPRAVKLRGAHKKFHGITAGMLCQPTPVAMETPNHRQFLELQYKYKTEDGVGCNCGQC